MSTEIERYEPHNTVVPRPATDMDSWVDVVRDVSRLASQIADTPFVPDGMRGNPAAVTAAMLMGREMSLGPMTSLQHLHVIKGKVGKSAEIMRALVLAAGHEIRDVETNDSRCVIEGRRSGEEMWTRVAFTADQARKAKIDLGGYPEDKLYARATTRLCRRKFADVVGGIVATVDELEDGDVPALGPAEPGTMSADGAVANAQPAKRIAKRKTSTRAASEPATPPAPAEPASTPPAETAALTAGPESADAGPPLPGEFGYDETGGPAEPTNGGDKPVTMDQLKKLHAQLNQFDIKEKTDKLTTIGLLVKRDLASSSELTIAEASGVIDLLEQLLDSDAPAKALDAVLDQLEQAEPETEAS